MTTYRRAHTPYAPCPKKVSSVGDLLLPELFATSLLRCGASSAVWRGIGKCRERCSRAQDAANRVPQNALQLSRYVETLWGTPRALLRRMRLWKARVHSQMLPAASHYMAWMGVHYDEWEVVHCSTKAGSVGSCTSCIAVKMKESFSQCVRPSACVSMSNGKSLVAHTHSLVGNIQNRMTLWIL
eukprot:2926424-Amphidinium_carterae.1